MKLKIAIGVELKIAKWSWIEILIEIENWIPNWNRKFSKGQKEKKRFLPNEKKIYLRNF